MSNASQGTNPAIVILTIGLTAAVVAVGYAIVQYANM